jgi:spermidine synthase
MTDNLIDRKRNILFLAFALSGFAGLIYESIWTHYLKLFLGHAAYAQSLVLTIFMGGMALGSWISSRYSGRSRNLLMAYSLTEGAIGLFALVFHNYFDYAINKSYSDILPHLSTPALVVFYKWTLSSAMVLPQSILLGMTFPLMTAGFIRLFPERPGHSVALVYFTNSIGAAIGVLVSGFVLVRFLGLPGTIKMAGLINIFLAFLIWILVRNDTQNTFSAAAVSIADRHKRWPKLLLCASLLTGTASFIYEIGWIRMLSLVLGSSTHSFELMLSSFIIGLAFGGLWIRRRLDGNADILGYLSVVQVIMGLFAISTLLVYGNTFEVMKWLVNSLNAKYSGYVLFNISSNAIALAIMLPATFCAGMTLPLITVALMNLGYGEKSIGTVYSANTIGAIIGVFFSIHLGLPILGLKDLIIFGAVIDIGVGLALSWSASVGKQGRSFSAGLTVLSFCAVIGVFFFVDLDPYKMASGVYRHGSLLNPEHTKVKYYRDGKTASVSLIEDDSGLMAISTNGKIDASINVAGPPEATSPDEATMTLAAAIPIGIRPGAKTVANIGLGSGLTTQTFLGDPLLDRVDTIEIESQMIKAAKNFGPLVERTYNDPRSKLFIDDAKTYFSVYQKHYDIIVSEPSNPWVSGVAGLFSDEFYRTTKRYMNKKGLFVQWIQLYETNPDLVASVMKAVSRNFSDYVIYATTNVNTIVIATNEGEIGDVDPSIFNMPEIARAMKKVHIEGMQDLMIRKLGSKATYSDFFENFSIHANSDYYPVLDQNADRTRFLKSDAMDFLRISDNQLPVIEMISGAVRYDKHTTIVPSTFYMKSLSARAAMEIRDYILHNHFSPSFGLQGEARDQIVQLAESTRMCRPEEIHDIWAKKFPNLLVMALPYLSPEEIDSLWNALKMTQCRQKLFDVDKDWFFLFEAVGKRDGANMSVYAQKLLKRNENYLPVAFRYLVVSGMLGELSRGNKEESLALLNRYGNKLIGKKGSDLLLRFLLVKSCPTDKR